MNKVFEDMNPPKIENDAPKGITLQLLISILESTQKPNFIAKFGGHMHDAPKETFNKWGKSESLPRYEYTPGFKHFQDESRKANIYILMGGSLDPHYKNGKAATQSYINYFPSYLMLSITNLDWNVRGFIVRDLEVEL